jgi:hypothetical protein
MDWVCALHCVTFKAWQGRWKAAVTGRAGQASILTGMWHPRGRSPRGPKVPIETMLQDPGRAAADRERLRP